ncbi:MAG: hypothetical protein ABSE62_05625 [Chthoniobacteraceae bacterium]|jgi:hypothetical protein
MRRPATSLLAAAAALCIGALAAHADDSLYDSSNLATPSFAVQHFLGPKSGRIHYDARMIRAAEIALSRAHSRPTWMCWHYVKDALVAARVIDSRPVSPWAKEAGDELCSRYGFIKLPVRNPRKAPVGAVLVYGGPDAGHVEIRTWNGYVSDFISPTPYPRPFIGAYVKPS